MEFSATTDNLVTSYFEREAYYMAVDLQTVHMIMTDEIRRDLHLHSPLITKCEFPLKKIDGGRSRRICC